MCFPLPQAASDSSAFPLNKRVLRFTVRTQWSKLPTHCFMIKVYLPKIYPRDLDLFSGIVRWRREEEEGKQC